MKLVYDPNYWKDYFDGPYEVTYRYGFDLEYILRSGWDAYNNSRPTSFADIGCGPGLTLVDARKVLGSEATIYGVEIQQLPKQQIASPDVIFGDFMALYPKLKPVELLYVSCSMYVPWSEQEEFLKACCKLSLKALYFANLYLEDRDGIPSDRLRCTIYRDRAGFRKAIETISDFKRLDGSLDFFVKKS